MSTRVVRPASTVLALTLLEGLFEMGDLVPPVDLTQRPVLSPTPWRAALEVFGGLILFTGSHRVHMCQVNVS